jgi:hypothetical protein
MTGRTRELTVHRKGGLEAALGEKVSVDAPQALRFDIDKQTGTAFAAGEARTPFQFPSRRIAADDIDGIGYAAPYTA